MDDSLDIENRMVAVEIDPMCYCDPLDQHECKSCVFERMFKEVYEIGVTAGLGKAAKIAENERMANRFTARGAAQSIRDEIRALRRGSSPSSSTESPERDK